MSLITPNLTTMSSAIAAVLNIAASASAAGAVNFIVCSPFAGLSPRSRLSDCNNTSVAGDERTIAVFQRPERLIRRNGDTQLVDVARIFRFRRRLDLKQISRMDGAAVDTDRALAKQRIVGRDVLHLGDLGFAVGGAFERRDRLEVMQGGAIDARLIHVREFSRPLDLPALGPGAGAVIHVPIKRLGQP